MNPYQQAFESTLYTVLPDGVLLMKELIIRIHQPNVELQRFLEEKGLDSWAFLTAWNPFVRKLSMKENVARNAQLEQLLKGYQYLFAEGRPAKPEEWEAEASFFVMDISEAKASRMGEQFEQQAIVVGRAGEEAELVWLKV